MTRSARRVYVPLSPSSLWHTHVILSIIFSEWYNWYEVIVEEIPCLSTLWPASPSCSWPARSVESISRSVRRVCLPVSPSSLWHTHVTLSIVLGVSYNVYEVFLNDLPCLSILWSANPSCSWPARSVESISRSVRRVCLPVSPSSLWHTHVTLSIVLGVSYNSYEVFLNDLPCPSILWSASPSW